MVVEPNTEAEKTHKVSGGNKKSKKLRHDKRKNGKISRTGIEELGKRQDNEDGDRVANTRNVESGLREKKLQKSRKKKRENVESVNGGGIEEFGTQQNNEDGDRVSDKRNVESGLREKKSQKSRKKKRENVESINERGSEEFGTQQNNEDGDRVFDRRIVESALREKKLQKSRKKKRENVESINEGGSEEFGTQQNNEDGVRVSDRRNFESAMRENNLQKSRKKKRKNVESVNKGDGISQTADASEQHNDRIAKDGRPNKADTRRNTITGKLKKHRKKDKESQLQINELTPDNLLEKRGQDAEDDEVYQMSSGDEDYSKGMKKWITQYHQSRPGLKLLQERIDDFIMAHEAQLEQARIEREAQAAEGGWTVVVHHKGRKKTTDAESGVAVGSVAQVAVLDKMEKKKKKEVGLDFYSFQKKEARRNELMMLQSKFEEDKKRIQQMRAARKFRPY